MVFTNYKPTRKSMCIILDCLHHDIFFAPHKKHNLWDNTDIIIQEKHTMFQTNLKAKKHIHRKK